MGTEKQTERQREGKEERDKGKGWREKGKGREEEKGESQEVREKKERNGRTERKMGRRERERELLQFMPCLSENKHQVDVHFSLKNKDTWKCTGSWNSSTGNVLGSLSCTVQHCKFEPSLSLG